MEVRNKVSHNEKFTYDDAERALDTIRRLLVAVSASEAADKVGAMRDEVLRIKFRELARNEERKKTPKIRHRRRNCGGPITLERGCHTA